VRLAGRDGFLLVHVEHQARREREIGRRLFPRFSGCIG
jgi:hypothetical protein